jgi:transposase
LTPFAKETVSDLYDQLVDLEQWIEKMDKRLERLFKKHPVCQKIAAVPGLGILTATAFLAAVASPQVFQNGRLMAAWFDLVPRQHSSGGKEKLGRLSKWGNRYLQTLLIHGERAVVRHAEKKKDSQSLWTTQLKIGEETTSRLLRSPIRMPV